MLIGIKLIFLIIILLIIFCIIKRLLVNKNLRFKRGITDKIDIENGGYIPKYVFKTGISNYDDLNEELVFLFNKIVDENDDFELEYYSDEDSRKFIENNYDHRVLSAYDKLKPGSYKADLFRYCILYKRGGVYSDLSQTIVLPIKEMIDLKNDNLYLVEDRPQPNYKGKDKGVIVEGIQISFMASRPKNKIYLDAINEIISNCENNFYGGNPLSPTGPHLFKRILNNYKEDYKIDLVENGKELVYKDTKKVAIINRTKNHYTVNLNQSNNKKHYTYLWFKNDIYN